MVFKNNYIFAKPLSCNIFIKIDNIMLGAYSQFPSNKKLHTAVALLAGR
jgi:hypothetical protein